MNFYLQKIKSYNIAIIVLSSVIINIIPLIGLIFFDWDINYFIVFAFIGICLTIVFEMIKIPLYYDTEKNPVVILALIVLVLLAMPGLMAMYFLLKDIINIEEMNATLKGLTEPIQIFNNINIPILAFLLFFMGAGYFISLVQSLKNKQIERSPFIKFPNKIITIIYRSVVILIGIIILISGAKFLLCFWSVIILMFPLKVYIQLFIKLMFILIFLIISKIFSSVFIFALLYLAFNTFEDIRQGIKDQKGIN